MFLHYTIFLILCDENNFFLIKIAFFKSVFKFIPILRYENYARYDE